jgi:elongation factor 2
MTKSPNKHNRLYMKAAPLAEGLAEDIDNDKISSKEDPKERSKKLVENYGWEK